MSKPIIRRTCIWALVIAAIAVAAVGVYQAAYWVWARQTVEWALSGNSQFGNKFTHITEMGDRAVPLTFAGLRRNPDPRRWRNAATILSVMAGDGKLRQSAPYICNVLADTEEKEDVRLIAAYLLSEFWDSLRTKQVLIDCIHHDPSIRIRAMCVRSLGGFTAIRMRKTGETRISADTMELLTASINDRDATIRFAACEASGRIAFTSQHLGVEQAECLARLKQCSKDSDPRVREWADRYLDILDKLRKNQQASHGKNSAP